LAADDPAAAVTEFEAATRVLVVRCVLAVALEPGIHARLRRRCTSRRLPRPPL